MREDMLGGKTETIYLALVSSTTAGALVQVFVRLSYLVFDVSYSLGGITLILADWASRAVLLFLGVPMLFLTLASWLMDILQSMGERNLVEYVEKKHREGETIRSWGRKVAIEAEIEVIRAERIKASESGESLPVERDEYYFKLLDLREGFKKK